MFQHFPEKWILVRYELSVAFCILGMAVGIGLMFQRELFRKIFLGILFLSILGMPLKHPFRAFYHIALYNEVQYNLIDYPANTVVKPTQYPRFPAEMDLNYLKNPLIPRISQVIFILMDICFALGGFYYFTRPQVRNAFKKKRVSCEFA